MRYPCPLNDAWAILHAVLPVILRVAKVCSRKTLPENLKLSSTSSRTSHKSQHFLHIQAMGKLRKWILALPLERQHWYTSQSSAAPSVFLDTLGFGMGTPQKKMGTISRSKRVQLAEMQLRYAPSRGGGTWKMNLLSKGFFFWGLVS